jgi:hypothetical protein
LSALALVADGGEICAEIVDHQLPDGGASLDSGIELPVIP